MIDLYVQTILVSLARRIKCDVIFKQYVYPLYSICMSHSMKRFNHDKFSFILLTFQLVMKMLGEQQYYKLSVKNVDIICVLVCFINHVQVFMFLFIKFRVLFAHWSKITKRKESFDAIKKLDRCNCLCLYENWCSVEWKKICKILVRI